jgi:hypothetical protein
MKPEIVFSLNCISCIFSYAGNSILCLLLVYCVDSHGKIRLELFDMGNERRRIEGKSFDCVLVSIYHKYFNNKRNKLPLKQPFLLSCYCVSHNGMTKVEIINISSVKTNKTAKYY